MKRFRKYSQLCTILLLFLSLALLPSCHKKTPENRSSRYIITSPELAEIVAAIQGVKNIVGITTECDHPQQLQSIAKVGTFGKIDIEKVLELEPTLVFVAGLEQDEVAYQLQKFGIPILSVYPRSIENMLDAIENIGIALEDEQRASELQDSLRQVIISFRNSQIKYSPRIYVEIYGNPLMSISDSSYVGELVELAGADNIFSNLPRAYSRIKAEDVIALDPEIILLTYPGIRPEDVKNRMGWEVISACRNDRIYSIDDVDPDLILRAGPRIGAALLKLSEIL